MTIPSEIGVRKLLNEQSGLPDKGRGVGHWLNVGRETKTEKESDRGGQQMEGRNVRKLRMREN